jgi:hypothetical protein
VQAALFQPITARHIAIDRIFTGRNNIAIEVIE